jgi:hypothetical protein
MANGAHTEAGAVARDCGLQLLEISSTYERRVIRPETGPVTLAIVGLVARQRRLLRGAYLLADADQQLQAAILVRAMLEFFIRQLWLQTSSMPPKQVRPAAMRPEEDVVTEIHVEIFERGRRANILISLVGQPTDREAEASSHPRVTSLSAAAEPCLRR